MMGRLNNKGVGCLKVLVIIFLLGWLVIMFGPMVIYMIEMVAQR